jgi:hypothetical protein
MRGNEIFLPMLATMALTALVWFYMYARRIPAMYRAGLSAQTYTTPSSVIEHLPAEVNYSANNFNNLCQLPVLFYSMCLYVFVSGTVDAMYVAAAWIFFALRTLHSLNHCTRNIVILRFYLYAASALALWFMLGKALLNELTV